MLMGLMLVTREKRIPAPIKLTVRPLKGLATTSLDSKQIRRCVVHMKEPGVTHALRWSRVIRHGDASLT